MDFTTLRSRSVPMWGLWEERMSSGAPCSTSTSSTAESRGSWVPVVSLPSEKAPAPPSPNWTLEAGHSSPGGPEPLHVGGPGVHVPAPLQHDGGEARPGQEEGGEEPRRPQAHHHRGQGGGRAHRGEPVGLGPVEGDVPVFCPADQPGLPVHSEVHGADVVDIALPTGIDGLPGQGEVLDGPGGDAQDLGGLPPQVGEVPLQGEGEAADADHPAASSEKRRAAGGGDRGERYGKGTTSF